MCPSIMVYFAYRRWVFLLKAVLARDCIPGLGVKVSSSVTLLLFLLSEVWVSSLCSIVWLVFFFENNTAGF